jgi:hypothetical protein
MDQAAKQKLLDLMDGGRFQDTLEFIDRLLTDAQTAAIAMAAELLPHDEVIPIDLSALQGKVFQGTFTARSPGHQQDCTRCTITALSPQSVEDWRKLVEVEARLDQAKKSNCSNRKCSSCEYEQEQRAQAIADLETAAAALREKINGPTI